MISIAQKMLPFSLQPGISMMIPGQDVEVQVFPALVRFFRIDSKERTWIKDVKIAIEGPLEHFMVIQDLERGCIAVYCDKLRYSILPDLKILYSKNPKMPLRNDLPRLSLGNHKKMEWEKMKARADFTELFPLWYRLASFLPPLLPRTEKKGMFQLLDMALLEKHPQHLLKPFRKLFLAAFRGLFVPRLIDDDHQGITHEVSDGNPLYFLKECGELIQSMIVSEKENTIEILPLLPPEFFAGRLLNLGLNFGTIDLEWTKKMIRKIQFRSRQEGWVTFKCENSIKEFRLRTSLHEKGTIHQAREPVEIKSGRLYLLDRFQK